MKSHLSRIFAKLGLRDRAAAVVYAFDHGIVTPRTSIVDDAPVPPVVVEPARGPGLRFSVLGPLRAWRGGTPLDLGPVRQQALLAALVLRCGVTVSQTELLDGVWGLEPPGTGGRVLPVYVHRLRKCLRGPGERTPDSVIGHARGGYRFDGDGVRLDTARLTELDADAGAAEAAGDLAAAVTSCSAALGLFHGEPLSGLPGPFAEGQRLRLTERRGALWTRKARLQLRLGRYAETADELSAVLALEPLREPWAALLMRALQATGRRAEAIAVYGRTRDRLAAELGVEPGEELRRTHRAVLDDELPPG
ncbi:BTAD domain-containing putative transcriptional regulator [Amycolatopsis sp. NPDC004378]